MPNSFFDFKRFRIEQDRCSMKVGTDGVLLGAWFPMEPGMSVLDIGTGTGLIALMAAQRGAGAVTAVEIDTEAAGQAAGNAERSGWAGLIKVVNADISRFTADSRFDRIVCNPPYFRDSLRSPDARRNTARHNDSLSYETLARRCADLLSPSGLLSLVLPNGSVGEFVRCAAGVGLHLCRRTDVVTAPGKPPKRSLVAFAGHYSEIGTDVLSISGPDGEETSDYINLVKDFYLKY
ncbi:MAG: methyltransferase [Bacteroidaceae bacterium]|nr:methyltransferase [Bacteroidaceae bacterium]